MDYDRRFITCSLALFVSAGWLAGLPAPVAAQVCVDAALTPPCVNSGDLRNGQVRTPDLANAAVTTPKLVTNAVTGAKVLDASLTGIDIKNGSLTGVDIKNGSLTGADIKNGSLTRADLAANAVTSVKVMNESLRAVDLFDEAGVEFAEGAEIVSLDPGGTTVRSITLTHPTGGFVLASATGSSNFNNVPGGMRCSITTGTAVDSSNRIVLQSPGNLSLIPFGLQRAFTVVGTASTIFRLVCDELSGNVQVDGSNLFAIFVPTRY